MSGKTELTFCFESFYPSNIPYNHLLKDITEECCHRDYSVKVITTFKHNKDEHRIMLDFFNKNQIKSLLFKTGKNTKLSSLFFPARVFLHLLCFGRGTVIIPSTPPAIMGFSVFLACKLCFSRFNYVYHCQDIHPEALMISSTIKNPILTHILHRMDRLTVKYAKKVIVLSEDMKKTLLKRYDEELNHISIINNFIPSAYTLTSHSKHNTVRDNHNKKDSVFIFAGNLGTFQNLEIFLEGFIRLDRTANAHLYFIGDGKIKNKLVKIASSHTSKHKRNIHFLDKMSSSKITQFISTADYGVVSISNGLLNVAYPSKIATYLSLGLPLLLCGGKHSYLEEEVDKNSLGISIDGENIDTIQKGLELAIREKNTSINKRLQIKDYYERNHDRKKIISDLIDEFQYD